MISPLNAATRSILVVEDESLLRMMAVDLFEEAGFRVIEAKSGDEAAQLLGGDAIDGLFTDIEMPGHIDGIALARITHEMHPNVAVIVVSARTTPLPGELPIDARFVDKPYDSASVLATITEMMSPSGPMLFKST